MILAWFIGFCCGVLALTIIVGVIEVFWDRRFVQRRRRAGIGGNE